MITLSLIGIGTGNPKHLTREAVEAIAAQDLILIPNKGDTKDDLAGLRRAICADVLQDIATPPQIVEFDLPTRDPAITPYTARVEDWHDRIADVWRTTIHAHLGSGTRVGFLVWGDPSLYDSTMRIAQRLQDVSLRVIAGITSVQALTAAHAIPLNDIGAPVIITTGRQIRDTGWPTGADTVVVMLDGDCAFQSLPDKDVMLYWTAYAGMENEISLSGPLNEIKAKVISTRSKARAGHGWIMDIYIMRRSPSTYPD